ncbi:rCG59014 [Rattus norvegicus]|uniref:RCG59014 n=1 Tax=Rattus norvegicus TaxID=10116 RepID=A6JPJ1_RAT|nr:rCG59014 [Rattus norvegicus]
MLQERDWLAKHTWAQGGRICTGCPSPGDSQHHSDFPSGTEMPAGKSVRALQEKTSAKGIQCS